VPDGRRSESFPHITSNPSGVAADQGRSIRTSFAGAPGGSALPGLPGVSPNFTHASFALR
jgi:hypothetical protein